MSFFSGNPVPPGQDSRSTELPRLLALLRFTLTVAALMLAIWLIGDVLAVIFSATLVAIILHGLAKLLRKRLTFLPYTAAVGLVAALIIGAFTILVWGNGPAIGEQFVSLKTALITQSSTLHDRLSSSTIGRILLDHLPPSVGGSANGSSFGGFNFGLAGSVTGLLSSVFGLLGTIVVILIAGFYFALSPSLYIDGFLRLVPPKHRDEMRDLLLTAGSTLWAWTAGQALDMLVVGLLSSIGLSLIGIPLALALGVVAGLCNFIPYIGAILGAIPALLISLSVGTREALFVAILYSIIQFFEGNVLAPLIQRRAVHMPPALAILSQTMFSTILGVAGLVLASPITAALLAVGDKATPPLKDKTRTQLAVDEINSSDRSSAPKDGHGKS